jgi:hypothetical protein
LNDSWILGAIDREIARLQRARALLVRDGMPKKVGSKMAKKTVAKKKRVVSPEGRARIAEAQRLRWAAVKKGK